MGNQLALGADVNVKDIHDGNLRGKGQLGGGKGRLLKALHCGHNDGDVVVKVFLKTSDRDHQTCLQEADKLRECQERLQRVSDGRVPSNVCFYSRFHYMQQQKKQSKDKDAAYLIRTYFRHSLQERVMTRPFVPKIGRLWMSYQLLSAVAEMHVCQVPHGDLKAENVMVTSMGWIMVVDLAPFKPTFIPVGNPSNFSYFFDTAENRHCTLAPERFNDALAEQPRRRQDTAEGEIAVTEKMDVFSAGCTIAQLFRDGEVLFQLDTMLSYKAAKEGGFDPLPGLRDKIKDESVIEMIMALLDRSPATRPTARQAIERYTPSVFPSYFADFHRHVMGPLVHFGPDKRVESLNSRLDEVLDYVAEQSGEEHLQGAAVLLANVLVSCVRHCVLAANTVHCLQLMARLAQYAGDDCCLHVLLPYAVTQLASSDRLVRATAVRSVSAIVREIHEFAPGEARLFEEYIIDHIRPLASDESALVRATLAEVLPDLATDGRRFLEARQLMPQLVDAVLRSGGQGGYDSELMHLRKSFWRVVYDLVQGQSAPLDPHVARGFLCGIQRLCLFFGRHMTDSDILPVIAVGTYFLNAPDFQVRRDVHKKLLEVALHVGNLGLGHIHTMLLSGLNDTEESVVAEALGSLEQLTRLGMMEQARVREAAHQIALFLMHPSQWIRDAAVGFFGAVQEALSEVDILCFILPAVQPYLKYKMLCLTTDTLTTALLKPIDRQKFHEAVQAGTLSTDHIAAPSGPDPHRQKRTSALQQHVRSIASGLRSTSTLPQPTEPELVLDVQQSTAALKRTSWSELEFTKAELDPRVVDAASADTDAQPAEPHPPECPRLMCAKPSERQRKRMELKHEEQMLKRAEIGIIRPRDRSGSPYGAGVGGTYREDDRYAFLREAKPNSSLICQSEEHEAAVTGIAVHDTKPIFLTASMDTKVLLWNAAEVDQEAALSSKCHFTDVSAQGAYSPVLSVEMMSGDQNYGFSGNAEGTLSKFCLQSGVFVKRWNLANSEAGAVSVLKRAAGSEVMVAATYNGYLCGTDIRSEREVFNVKADRSHGPMTGLAVGDEDGSGVWAVTATSQGYISLWDLRFRMVLRHWCIREPAHVVSLNGSEPVVLVGASDIQSWSLEKCSLVARYTPGTAALPAPPATAARRSSESVGPLASSVGRAPLSDGRLSVKEAADALPEKQAATTEERPTVRCVCGSRDMNWFITGGTDRMIRYWDPVTPRNSYVISGLRRGEAQPKYSPVARSQVNEVVEQPVVDASSRRTESQPGLKMQNGQQHKDAVTALALLRPSAELPVPLLVSASRDGCVKMWQNNRQEAPK